MPEPAHAVVVDGIVTNVVLMDAATADEFREQGFVDQLWPGGELVDVTDADPAPGIGWTYDGGTFAAPPEPDPEQQPDEQQETTTA